MVDALVKDAPAKKDVPSTQRAHSSKSDLESSSAETVTPAPISEARDDSEGGTFTVQKFGCKSYTTLLIMTRLGHITEISCELRAVNLDQKNRVRPFTQVDEYDYISVVLVSPFYIWR